MAKAKATGVRKPYSEVLKSPKWQKKRLQIMERDHFQCRGCGDEESELQVHHSYYEWDKEPWEYDNRTLITLCADCHTDQTPLIKSSWATLKATIALSCQHASSVEAIASFWDRVAEIAPGYGGYIAAYLEDHADTTIERIVATAGRRLQQ